MPYSKFTISRLEKEFHLTITKEDLFNDLNLDPSDWLKETLNFTSSLTLNSEKAKSEFIIAPILLDIRNQNSQSFEIFSGENLDVDESLDLNGECDFILTKNRNSIIVEAPILSIVEAKRDEINPNSIAQSMAQMLGAKIFNEREKNGIDTIFGCVTTGEIWQFMKLTNNLITLDKKRYYIDNISGILGRLQQIIDFYTRSS